MRAKAKTPEDDGYDKDWARRYILDPLTAPEPNQETGPGASHVNPYRAAAASAASASSSAPPSRHAPPASYEQPKALRFAQRGELDTEADADADEYPTPPASASPTHGRFPFAAAGAASCDHQHDGQPPLLDTHDEETLIITPPASPLLPKDSVLIAQQQQQHRRYPSVPVADTPSPWADPDPGYPRNRQRSNTDSATANLQRRPSLRQRFPGDMSNRPLDMLKADARAADRRPRRRRRHISETDVIDALDTIGGSYHHGGPYDATLASRNLDKKYSPVAAVEDSNLEALRATPRENIVDSLRHHVPLQGTASIPSGGRDMSGNLMRYAEGADLMREPDVDGGAYKRWLHL
ncbi:Uncharacterized protein TCAP_01727, partial [Tolypocladium capitatum]